MKATLEVTPRHKFTPNRDVESAVFWEAVTTHEVAKIHLRARDGGFVKDASDSNVPIDPLDVVEVRFKEPAHLYALAELFRQVAERMEAMRASRHPGGTLSYAAERFREMPLFDGDRHRSIPDQPTTT